MIFWVGADSETNLSGAEVTCTLKGDRPGFVDGLRRVELEGPPVSSGLPEKVINQIRKAGLPIGGPHPFRPKLTTNRAGEQIIVKMPVRKGPKAGKRGYVDEQGRIWVKDRAPAGVPDHWDVQVAGGEKYFRVDHNGDEIRRERETDEP